MSADTRPGRLVLNLNDTTKRIFGPECTEVVANADLGTVEVVKGVNGAVTSEGFNEVNSLSFEGSINRFVRQRGDGERTLEYPRRLAMVDYSLQDSKLLVQFVGDQMPTVEREVKALVLG